MSLERRIDKRTEAIDGEVTVVKQNITDLKGASQQLGASVEVVSARMDNTRKLVDAKLDALMAAAAGSAGVGIRRAE